MSTTEERAREYMQAAFQVGGGQDGRPAGWFARARQVFASLTPRERWSRQLTRSVRRHGADGRAGV